jgi:hypothetical protein
VIGTDLAMPVQTAYEDRTGLVYELEDGGVYFYKPAAVFFVDGIRYDPHRRGKWSRPMLEIFDDDNCGGFTSMVFSTPMSEADLDAWVGLRGWGYE